MLNKQIVLIGLFLVSSISGWPSAWAAPTQEEIKVSVQYQLKTFDEAQRPRVDLQGSTRLWSLEMGKTWSCQAISVLKSEQGIYPGNILDVKTQPYFRFTPYGDFIRNENYLESEKSAMLTFNKLYVLGHEGMQRGTQMVYLFPGKPLKFSALEIIRATAEGGLIGQILVKDEEFEKISSQFPALYARKAEPSNSYPGYSVIQLITCPKSEE